MEITEVRIKLMDDNDDRLQAFCSITFDGEFVVRDLKIIEGQRGLFTGGGATIRVTDLVGKAK